MGDISGGAYRRGKQLWWSNIHSWKVYWTLWSEFYNPGILYIILLYGLIFQMNISICYDQFLRSCCSQSLKQKHSMTLDDNLSSSTSSVCKLEVRAVIDCVSHANFAEAGLGLPEDLLESDVKFLKYQEMD